MVVTKHIDWPRNNSMFMIPFKSVDGYRKKKNTPLLHDQRKKDTWLFIDIREVDKETLIYSKE